MLAKSAGRGSKPLPHDGVYTRLRPSRRGGVGVFAIRNIRKGTDIFGDDDDEIVWVERSRLRRLPREVRRLYEDFCIITDKGRKYGCPTNFNRLTLSWYLNSSTNPNVVCDKDYKFSAKRNIRAGEELTVDYSTYNEFH
jgi:hypothetical protein